VRSTLRSPRLRRILAAYTVNRMGSFFGLVALLVAVYDHAHSALAIAALMFAGQALPAFAVTAVVARAEASRRRSELTALFMFEAVATAGLAVLVAHFSLAPVLVLVAFDGIAALAASALVRAEVARAARDQLEVAPHALAMDERLEPPPGMVGEIQPPALEDSPDALRHEAERSANAALTVAFSITFVLGPVLGGALVAGAGVQAALLIDVGSFLVCGLLLLDLHPHVEEAAGESIRSRLRAAWRHIHEVPQLRGLLLAEAAALLFIETGAPIEVPFVKGTLNAGNRGLGLVLTMWGAGAVIGSVAFARLLRRPLGELLAAGTLLIGAAYLGLAAAPNLALACVAGLAGGIGNSLQWPALISLVQQVTPASLQGRMMGAAESLGAICLAAGLVLGGVLVAVSSPRAAFVVVGVGAIAATFALLRVVPPPAAAAVADEHELADAHGLAESSEPGGSAAAVR
jgi:predicted MFS family arabinose efflux permease